MRGISFFLCVLFGVILLYIILCFIVHQSTHIVSSRHHTDEYEFAHFSRITETNKWFFPSYVLTAPLYFTVSEGQAVVIPRGWWHWVKYEPGTLAISYWNKSSEEPRPRLIPMPDDDLKRQILISLSEMKNLNVWNSKRDIVEKNSKAGCIITLPGYSTKFQAKMNHKLHDNIKPYLTYPHIKGWDKHVDTNVWIALSSHDTGLHYDDYDGVLQVVQGRKHIRLFPPSQSKWLHPYSVIPSWARGKAERVAYNKYVLFRVVKGLPSARLLYESIRARHNKNVMMEVSKLKNTPHPYVWGCKWQDGIMRWEMYRYYYDRTHQNPITLNRRRNADKPCIIESFDLFDLKEDALGDTQHFYYSNQGDRFRLPFHGTGTQKKLLASEESHEGVFIYDTTFRWLSKFDEYLKSLECPTQAQKCRSLLGAYVCDELCVWNKGSNNIFIQYLGISIHAFCLFLQKFQYPNDLVKHVLENVNQYQNICHEITIVYDISSLQPIRSAFYGILCS